MDGKVVVVTGAAQGIGRAYAMGLAEAGAAVVVVDIDVEGTAAVADAIDAAGGQALAANVDVTDEAALKELAGAIDERFGRLDAIVNNAAVEGAPLPTPLTDLSTEEFDRVMAVNVKGMWLVTRTLLPLLERTGGGAVVNQGSVGAFLATASYLPYVTSKNAVFGVTKTLARELGPLGIRVNSIAPGTVATESLARAIPAEIVEALVAAQCIGLQQQPEDLVDPLLFLLSDMSRFITGQTLVVDGGGVMLP